LWFTASELSRVSDVNTGPVKSFFGWPDSACAVVIIVLEYIPSPNPVAATVAIIVDGRAWRRGRRAAAATVDMVVLCYFCTHETKAKKIVDSKRIRS
jgi:hypothetical protein